MPLEHIPEENEEAEDEMIPVKQEKVKKHKKKKRKREHMEQEEYNPAQEVVVSKSPRDHKKSVKKESLMDVKMEEEKIV